jgi:hypothetical protein
MEQLKRIWSRIRLPLINGFIVCLLALILVDAMPFSPPLLRAKIAPLLYLVGLKQGEWNMFAPNPDSKNERLSAEIVYADGTVASWQSPAWREESPFARFPKSRRQEYLDNIVIDDLSPNPVTVEDFLAQQEGREVVRMQTARAVWDGLADYAAGHHAGPRPEAALASVRLYKETADIPDAADGDWPSMGEPAEYGEKTLVYERHYP